MSEVLTGIGDDYTILDGVEEVTFSPRNPAAIDIESVKALKGALTEEQLAFAGALGNEGQAASWILWDSALGSTVPKNGDQFTDSADREWTIYRVVDLRTGAYQAIAQ